jgi:hypothetical protein
MFIVIRLILTDNNGKTRINWLFCKKVMKLQRCKMWMNNQSNKKDRFIFILPFDPNLPLVQFAFGKKTFLMKSLDLLEFLI